MSIELLHQGRDRQGKQDGPLQDSENRGSGYLLQGSRR